MGRIVAVPDNVKILQGNRVKEQTPNPILKLGFLDSHRSKSQSAMQPTDGVDGIIQRLGLQCCCEQAYEVPFTRLP